MFSRPSPAITVMRQLSTTHPLTIAGYATNLLMLLLALHLELIAAVAVVALIGGTCVGFLARPHVPELLRRAAASFDSIDD